MRNDEQILKNTFEETAAPNKAFVKRLENRVLSEFQGNAPQNNFISLFSMKIPSNALKAGVLTIGALLFVGMAGGASYYAYNAYQQQLLKNDNEILAKIAKQNPSRNSGAYDMAKTSASGRESADSMLIAPENMNRDYNYMKSVTNYDMGPASTRCPALLPYEGYVTKDESSQFYMDKNEWTPSYSKYAAYADEDIYDYSLNVKDEQWTYKGGNYAVHVKNVERMNALAAREEVSDAVLYDSSTTSIDAPVVDREPVTTDPIEGRFGEGAKLLGKVEKDGNEYYRIQWSYQSGCETITNKDSVSLEMDTKIVSISLADSKTFEISEESYYINNSDESNRIYTRASNNETRTVNVTDVTGEFTFNFPVNVQTFDAAEFDYTTEYKLALVNYLKQEGLNVLNISSAPYKLQSASSNYVTVIADHEKHLTDRTFYSSKEYGQRMYDNAKDIYKPYLAEGTVNASLQLSYANEQTTGSAWINVSEYDKVYSVEELFKGMYYEIATNEKVGTLKLSVNGSAVNADVYTLKRDSVEPSAPNTGTGGGQDAKIAPDYNGTVSYEYLVVFSYEGRSYLLQTSSESFAALKLVMESLDFGKVSSSDTVALSKILTGTPAVVSDTVLK